MKQIIIGIYDKKSESISGISTATNIPVAIRNFQNICKNQESFLFQYPEDFSLVVIAEIDVQSGTIEHNAIKEIAKATDFVEQKNNQEEKTKNATINKKRKLR